jgi:hypothetical protein
MFWPTLALLALARHRTHVAGEVHCARASKEPPRVRSTATSSDSLEERMAPKTKDLSTKKDVKGGAAKTKLATNDNLTVIRAAKPAKKDLPAGKDVKGGKKAR